MSKDSMVKRRNIRALEAQRDKLKERRIKDSTDLKVVAAKLKELRKK